MGKKGSWFSAIRKVFTPSSKEKLANDSDKKSSKEKKKGIARRETNSFIPIFRQPSSIEKILGDVEREQLVFKPPAPPERPKTPSFVHPRAASPRAASTRVASPRATSPRAASPRAASPRATSPPPPPPPRAPSPRAASPTPRAPAPRAASPTPRAPAPRAASPTPRAPAPRAASPTPRAPTPRAASPPKVVRPQKETSYRPEPVLRHQHASATKIQAAYRGYMARRSFKALKGLVRLQGVVRGQNVKRQTANAMKYMQLLVRVQSQIQSRRIQMLENQARLQGRNDKGAESTMGKWSTASGAGNNEDWDDSLLTKEEVEARLQRKVEAVVKRERAMAFAYSNQLWKGTPKSVQPNTRAGGFPWWWNWLERQIPTPTNLPESQVMKSFQLTPPRPFSERKPSPRPQSSSSKQPGFGFDNFDSMTPKSTKSTFLMTPKQSRTPPFSARNLPQTSSASITSKYPMPRVGTGSASPFDMPMRDDDSLTSCPPFSVPNYMAPTASAKAKARASSNPKERFPGTPSSETNSRRLSFPMMAKGIGAFKWNKGSFFSNKDASSQRNMDKQSVGNMSVDSTVSLPVGVGRRPFNRFV